MRNIRAVLRFSAVLACASSGIWCLILVILARVETLGSGMEFWHHESFQGAIQVLAMVAMVTLVITAGLATREPY